jgi:3-dehydroquinate synthase
MFVIALVSAPFMIWGQDYVEPWLHSHEQQRGVLMAIAVMLLAADSVAPVPATFVIWFLAKEAGRIPGVIGGTVGMTAGVLAAAWLGRAAVGRIAPKFIPDAELARLRDSLQSRLAITLACLRSVPVLAETSVIVAAAAGVPVRRIVAATILPNFIVSVIYSLVAAESFAAACGAFLATMVASYVLWRVLGRTATEPENAGRPPA